jgi:hypothetical protein
MSWDAIAAIGEALGAVAVIVTLLYLAAQIRQNTQSNRTAALQMTSDHDTAFWSLISSNESLADILVRGNRSLRSLSEVEAARYSAAMMQLYRHWDSQLELHRSGIIPEHLWASFERGMAASLSTQGVQSWWQMARSQFSSELQERVDATLRTGVGTSPSAV